LIYYGHMLIFKKRDPKHIMSRPPCCRKINQLPNATYFKPRGVPLRDLEEVELTIDELEAIRLADLEGYYQEAAAEQMNVSRQTFGRIITQAHRKVADFLIGGKALLIEGGNFTMDNLRTFTCESCQHTWQVPYGTGRPSKCPACESASIYRTDGARGGGHGHGGGGRCLRKQLRNRQSNTKVTPEHAKENE
jgi:uncharacterized protein